MSRHRTADSTFPSHEAVYTITFPVKANGSQTRTAMCSSPFAKSEVVLSRFR